MKRWISIILALLLTLGSASAMAENDTLIEKFYQQALKESAYRGTVTFTVIGEETSVIPKEIWEIVKILAPNLTVTLEHTTQRNKDEGEANVKLNIGGAANATFSFLYDEAFTGIFSDMLNPDAVYTASRGWSWTRLFTASSQDGEGWPPLWQMLLNVLNASESWKKRAEPLLEDYETEIAVWIQTFASVSMGMNAGKTYSELSCKIPAQEVKEEIKTLLKMFYQDQQLLDLLKEVATAQEAAAYLQPSAMNTLITLVDGISMEGNVEIARRHDSSGIALLDSISFPFSQDALFTRLAFSVSPSEGGQEWRVTGAMKNGAEFDISCEQTASGSFIGSVALLVPVTEEGASFVVSDGTPELKPIGFDYSLNWDMGEETYSLADDESTQTMRGSLMIRPREGTDLPMQIFSLNAELSSSSAKTKPTYLNGNISWMDMESGAAITAALSSRTVSPFDYDVVSQAENAVRMDEMSSDDRASLLTEWIARVTQFFTSALVGNAEGAQE